MENITVLDFESTYNQTTKQEELIEFCAVEINQNLEVVNEFISLVNPLIPISFITKKVTGLGDQDFTNKPILREALPRLLSFLHHKPIVAHNALFEFKVLSYSCEKCGFPTIDNTFIDSMKIARYLLPTEKVSLSALGQRFGLVSEHHRAKGDVTLVIQLIRKFADIYQVREGKNLLEELYKFKINTTKSKTF